MSSFCVKPKNMSLARPKPPSGTKKTQQINIEITLIKKGAKKE